MLWAFPVHPHEPRLSAAYRGSTVSPAVSRFSVRIFARQGCSYSGSTIRHGLATLPVYRSALTVVCHGELWNLTKPPVYADGGAPDRAAGFSEGIQMNKQLGFWPTFALSVLTLVAFLGSLTIGIGYSMRHMDFIVGNPTSMFSAFLVIVRVSLVVIVVATPLSMLYVLSFKHLNLDRAYEHDRLKRMLR